jgi:uncharacterized phage-associated protein
MMLEAAARRPMIRQNLLGFRSRKAAQVSAIFLARAGGRMDKMKLIKLLYLTERESLAKRGRPIFYDEFYSLKDGPICSNALDGLNGQLDKHVWSAYVRKEGSKDILLVAEREHDEISESDFDILDSVWDQFGFMTTSQVRRWTHLHCPEYREVSLGCLPIDYRQIARALQLDDPNEIGDRVDEYRSLNAALT